ncbi:T9SS type B sorting domain-containing protein [Flavobacterium sp. J49]|uniref:T9SS type B sorting domain-containing protein n=1 Tax=Flavobacterium sp. J49 TaxID=2718534 RepID=UPI0015944ED1|nr:T9SS type B sorting domain-containing protein [Flavobacterium sp. J49]MBF6639928.1 T9SS type B sorting domain-containing protein [Flavobacterium sp. J49]NIC01173.1 T9SS type B sorting domain-containing protein [Flavobacterium sp. J49]
MKKKLFFLLFIAFSTINCFSQFSKTHYIPPLSGSSSVTSEDQFLYISTPNINPINFRIIELGGSVITGTVSRSTPYIYNVGFGNDTQLHVDAGMVNNVFNNKGYIVEADDLIYVSARVTAGSGNQAGELVSKGKASLGNRFRIGAITNLAVTNYVNIHNTFISVLASENNTTVNFSDIRAGVQPINSSNGNTPFSIVLNSGESYVMAVQGPLNANRDGLIGSLVTSDKPIALNCGSFGGSNAPGNLDLGFDQIVPAERINNNEYIFIKSTGIDMVETVLLVADVDNTEIYLSGSTTPSTTINAGDYVVFDGSNFDANGNLYISTSQKVFAYQTIGDNSATDQRNQEMFFVPPLSCQTPRIIDNIPSINFVGNRQFTGRVTIVTKTGAALNFIIDGVNYTLANLSQTASVIGPTNVVGNTDYETYIITGLTGDVSVFSTEELYLAAYGTSGAATFGGFYSGFTFEPEISFNQLDPTLASCIPNTSLSVNTLSPFDTFQWYFNGSVIPGATNSSYTPSTLGPGYYYVSATISNCSQPINSNEIPVSSCPIDTDNDGTNSNIDLDNDNDGITNCNESYGNQNINLTNTTIGTVAVGNYTNSFVGTVATTGTGTPSATPIVGDVNGNFVTEATSGKQNSISYTTAWNNPISLSLEYASTALPNDLFTASTEIRVTCPINKTLTILNPNNQVLVDTNYDGIFESGITEYSSFEIRFRLNSSISLAPGTGTFSVRGNLIDAITVSNINLVDTNSSRVTMRLMATCVPLDSDNDGIPDQNDYDSDNDTIPDLIESQGQNVVALSNTDSNQDGIDDVFGNGLTPADTDNDGVFNYLDLDSDNDGIHDLDESNSNALDSDNNGIIDGANFGTNGLANTLETTPDSGILNYSIADTDADGIYNYIELDSDNDLCFDVIEAGYLDPNGDGILGDLPNSTDSNGLLYSSSGYGIPNGNYIIGAPISISVQPVNVTTCELQSATFTVTSVPVDSYQWQLSTDGGTNWTNLTNNAIYSGVTTVLLTVSNVSPTMAGYQYRVFLNKNGNSCGLYSAAGILTTYALPVVTTPISLIQCDDDTDAITVFNLTQKNNVISANYLNETFTYFTTSIAANTENSAFEITNPLAYTSGNGVVYTRVENSNGCFRVVQINLAVSVTQIPANFVIPNQYLCDDYLDAVNNDYDGISGPFNFTAIQNSLAAILPANVTIKFYKTQADFLAETDVSGNSLAIADITNYRNIGFPNAQTIWVRVDSTIDNSCFGYKTFEVIVEALPIAYPVNAANLIRHCDDNHDGIYGFDTSGIEAAVVNGQTGVNVKYFRANGTQILPFTNPYNVTGTETITIRVSNNTTQTGGQPCYDEVSLQFIVDDLPEAFAIPNSLTTTCDDEVIAIAQDGYFDFDTTTFLNTILGTQTGMNVYYYDQNNVLIPSTNPNQLPNPFRTNTQNIRVVVENPTNTDCYAETTIPFVVNPTPKIDQEETIIICLPDTEALIDAGILDGTPASDYSFQWYENNVIMTGQTNQTITVNTPGLYSVEVTNAFNCTKTRNITILGSEIASIRGIEVVDLSDINSILVNVTGLGDYVFALDDINGPYQESNFFNNVPIGFHELYVRDQNGCGTLGPILIPVLGIPKYFTPNGDGFHDYWNVKGVSALHNYRSTIYIFDRYGKLLKQIGTTSPGWDGTYNGRPMPADDYWYSIEFEDGRNAKGHFTLKR